MAPWRALRLPLASCQVDTPSTVTGIAVARPRRDERHTLLFEHRALPLRAAEREAGRQRTVTEHDAMAGNHAGFGIGVQREADEPRIAWAAGQRRDLAVSRDRSARDPPDDVIHRTVERCRTVGRRYAAG